MRDQIQSEFDRRFGIQAYEIYGATEGNCILSNRHLNNYQIKTIITLSY